MEATATESAMKTRALPTIRDQHAFDSKYLILPKESRRLAKIKTAEAKPDRSVLYVHNQVLRIREEDSHLGEDFGEGLSTKDRLAFLPVSSHAHMDVFLYSRPMLSSSPLGNKTAIKSFQ